VLAHHLDLRRGGDLERDLRDNWHLEVVILTARQVFRGHDGVRASVHWLWRAVGGGLVLLQLRPRDERMALVERGARNEYRVVRSGVDSYLIENGWITAQTIHYDIEDEALSVGGNLLVRGRTGSAPFADPARMPVSPTDERTAGIGSDTPPVPSGGRLSQHRMPAGPSWAPGERVARAAAVLAESRPTGYDPETEPTMPTAMSRSLRL
jgi:hypothetical protein